MNGSNQVDIKFSDILFHALNKNEGYVMLKFNFNILDKIGIKNDDYVFIYTTDKQEGNIYFINLT